VEKKTKQKWHENEQQETEQKERAKKEAEGKVKKRAVQVEKEQLVGVVIPRVDRICKKKW
jgi:hypothetical protein